MAPRRPWDKRKDEKAFVPLRVSKGRVNQARDSSSSTGKRSLSARLQQALQENEDKQYKLFEERTSQEREKREQREREEQERRFRLQREMETPQEGTKFVEHEPFEAQLGLGEIPKQYETPEARLDLLISMFNQVAKGDEEIRMDLLATESAQFIEGDIEDLFDIHCRRAVNAELKNARKRAANRRRRLKRSVRKDALKQGFNSLEMYFARIE